jgi:poly(A) polymerase
MDEDAHRRDFTLNALYYDPSDSTLVDHVGGFKDIAAKRIEPVIPLKTIFKEDAVRMIRCVKYAATAGFRIPFRLRRAIKKDSSLLGEASPSRLTEEFLKILGSGSSAAIIKDLIGFSLLQHLAPEAASLCDTVPSYVKALRDALLELDAYVQKSSRENSLSILLSYYLKPFLEYRPDRFVDTPEAYRDAVHEARLFLSPLNPPRVELEAAVLIVFKKRGLSPIQRPPRKMPYPRGPVERGATRSAEHRELREQATKEAKPRRRRRHGPPGGKDATALPDGEASS